MPWLWSHSFSMPTFVQADYKLDEDALNEEEENNKSCCAKCCGGFMKVFSWPWQCVFKVTIPACERDAYQKWEKESTPYVKVPSVERSLLELDDDDDTDLHETKWFRGKYSKQKVDTWYAMCFARFANGVGCVAGGVGVRFSAFSSVVCPFTRVSTGYPASCVP